jgi:hypothetical protein
MTIYNISPGSMLATLTQPKGFKISDKLDADIQFIDKK